MNPPPAVNGQRPALPTIIGQTPMRFPVGGKIRAGIKVLTKAAGNNPRAREIYEHGVEAGRDFDSIEKEIAQAVPEFKNPLTPRNVPYFTARRADFAMPEVAEKILELYGGSRRRRQTALPVPGGVPGGCVASRDAACAHVLRVEPAQVLV
jgi:hypothetical protein